MRFLICLVVCTIASFLAILVGVVIGEGLYHLLDLDIDRFWFDFCIAAILHTFMFARAINNSARKIQHLESEVR